MRSPARTLLALDTSTRTIGLALYNGVQVLHAAIWNTQDYHTVELAPAVAEALKKTGIGTDGLSALAVALGPGSFTGLRVGMALAKGIAIMRHLPIIGVPTLDALAVAQPQRDIPLAAVLRAGRGRLAVGWYQMENGTWKASGKLEIHTPQDLVDQINTPTLICGELTEVERDLLSREQPNVILASPAHSLRHPAFLAELGWQRWQDGKVDDPATLAPIYLHHNDSIPG